MLGGISWFQLVLFLECLGDYSVRVDDGYASVLEYFFQAQKTLLRPWHHHHLYPNLGPPDTDWGQSVFQVGGRCIVPLHLWTEMSRSQTGPLDNDVTQYMHQGLLQPMVYSSK